MPSGGLVTEQVLAGRQDGGFEPGMRAQLGATSHRADREPDNPQSSAEAREYERYELGIYSAHATPRTRQPVMAADSPDSCVTLVGTRYGRVRSPGEPVDGCCPGRRGAG